jgi:adenine-specific DNA-methyltransferase
MTTDQPEKLDLRSHDIAGDKREELLRLFPEVRTEDGQIDFDRLRLALGDAVDVGKERYGMTWPGKAECFKAIQTPSLGTLLPCPDESVNFDTTENLIIEGDNLEVLKLLQKSYLGKVKMIYIDPPYNTGNDFIYPDNYSESLQTYLEYTGQVDAEGKRFGTNSDTDGRFHSKWLNMMYPRLYLARNLLREDGIAFVSIDDGEAANLVSIMNEVFGEEHQLAVIAWEKKFTRSNNARTFAKNKDTILCYRRSHAVERLREARSEKTDEIYSNPDNDPRGPWTSVLFVNPASKEARPNLVYPITNPFTGKAVVHPTNAWKQEASKAAEHERENRFYWGKDGQYKYPRLKKFLSEVQEGVVPTDLWAHKDTGTTDEGSKEVNQLLGKDVFDNPKPHRLIKRMLGLATTAGTADELVLDFFAGSGSTAHAVLEQNRDDGGNRRFILVQLPEPTYRDDFVTIADICKERVRRVINKLNEEDAGKLNLDGGEPQERGFRVFRLAESNFTPWNAEAPQDAEKLQEQLELHIDHIKEGRSPDDLLYELLLKSGFELTTPVETLEVAGKTVYSVADGALLICLDKELSLEAIRAMADRKPERAVCLDEGFAGNDQLKANAVQTFKTKGVTSFKTV